MGYPFWTMGGSPGGNHLFCTGCMFGATVCPWCRLRGFSDRAVSPRLSERHWHAAMRTDRKLQHMRTPLNVNLQMKGMTRDCTHDPNETWYIYIYNLIPISWQTVWWSLACGVMMKNVANHPMSAARTRLMCYAIRPCHIYKSIISNIYIYIFCLLFFFLKSGWTCFIVTGFMFVCLIYGVEICRIATSQGLRFHALPGAHRQVSRWWYHMYPYLLSSKTIQNCQSWETINYPFIYIYTSLYCILLDPLILERWPQKKPKFIWPGQPAKPRQGGLTRKGMDGLRGSPVSTESGTQWNHGRQASQPPPKSTQAWIWHKLAAFPSISCPISISMSCVPVALETAGRELPFKALQMSGFTLESLELGHDVQLEENQIHSTNIKIH